MCVIEINNLTKVYKNGVKSIDNLSLKIDPNTIFALLGPNGAGKTTLINILTTFLAPTSGSINVFGRDFYQNKEFVRSKIACVAQSISIDDHLSLYENLLFQSKLYHLSKDETQKRIGELIEVFDLGEYTKYKVIEYSGGIKRRLDIAMSMISHPTILFLDEPTVGLDVESRHQIWNYIKKIKEQYQTTILLTTHYLEEADFLSDKISIINEGKIIIEGTPWELKNSIKEDVISTHFNNINDSQAIIDELKKFNFVKKILLSSNILNIYVENSKESFSVIRDFLLSSKYDIQSIEIARPTLDDVFLKYTGKKITGVYTWIKKY